MQAQDRLLAQRESAWFKLKNRKHSDYYNRDSSLSGIAEVQNGVKNTNRKATIVVH